MSEYIKQVVCQIGDKYYGDKKNRTRILKGSKGSILNSVAMESITKRNDIWADIWKKWRRKL